MYTLMIKTHNVTGLKYLCKCSHSKYISYCGSGSYWKKHLRKHGRNVSTEILFQSDNLDEFSVVCNEYSKQLNVVDSNDWANLIHETGCDGGTTHHNPFWLKGYKHNDEVKIKISESSKKMWAEGRCVPSFTGKTHTVETKEKMSIAAKGKPKSLEHRESLKLAAANRDYEKEWNDHRRNISSLTMTNMLGEIYKCNICGSCGNKGHIARYHVECQTDPEYEPLITIERSSDIITYECVICSNIFTKKRKSKKCTCSSSCATNLYWKNKNEQ